jgi:hypothetical protein
MKIHVITDANGEIVATLRPGEPHDDVSVALAVPLPGQEVHEVELPKELEQIRNADQLHKELKNILNRVKG